MAGQRSSFGKLQRDRDKKAKAAAKRVRRQEGGDDRALRDAAEDTAVAPDPGRQLPTAELLERIAEIHQQFDAGVISYEQFEETKSDLLSRLPVD